MQGVIKGSSCQLGAAAHAEWWGHICGQCLALRDEHGQLARLTTNYDTALLSVLFEAQAPHLVQYTTNSCPLRRFRRIDVVQPSVPGARHAATISLLMGATNIRDHIADGDGWFHRAPRMLGHIAERWTTGARRSAVTLAFQPERIEAQTQRQSSVEQAPLRDFMTFSQPTELAVGAAFSHTATLAQQPANETPLEQIGRMYGRIMYLLDSYEDYRADTRAGIFNALAAAYQETQIYAASKQILIEAHTALKHSFQQLILPKPQLAHTLLLHTLRHQSLALLDANRPDVIERAGEQATKKSGFLQNCVDCSNCCDCCECCVCNDSHGCNCDCDCCSCDCCGCDC